MDQTSAHSVDSDGYADELVDVLAPGTRFGRYEIRKLLGHGAFGAVYEAQQVEPLQRTVALKVLHAVARTSTQVVGRFVREAQIAASITHPHICTVFDVGSQEGVPFIAMERLHGESLESRLERQRVLSPSATVDVMLPLLSAVAAVHDAGIVHRDLKPANMFLATPRPGAVVPKLLDFGIVKVLDRDAHVARTETRTFLGTPHYTSPEQAMDASSIDVRSDQWSLGVILYECLTGARPWRDGPVLQMLFEITAGEIEPPSRRFAGITPELDAVVMRALTRDVGARFASVRALAAALLPFASETARATWYDEFVPHAPTPLPPGSATPGAGRVSRASMTQGVESWGEARAEAVPAARTSIVATPSAARPVTSPAVTSPPVTSPPVTAPPITGPRPSAATQGGERWGEARFEPEPAPARPPPEPRFGAPRTRYSDLQAAPVAAAPPRRLLWPALALLVVVLLVAVFALRARDPAPAPAPAADPPVTAVPEPEPEPEPPAPAVPAPAVQVPVAAPEPVVPAPVPVPVPVPVPAPVPAASPTPEPAHPHAHPRRRPPHAPAPSATPGGIPNV